MQRKPPSTMRSVQIVRLWKSGTFTVKGIAKYFGIGQKTVQEIIKRSGKAMHYKENR